MSAWLAGAIVTVDVPLVLPAVHPTLTRPVLAKLLQLAPDVYIRGWLVVDAVVAVVKLLMKPSVLQPMVDRQAAPLAAGLRA